MAGGSRLSDDNGRQVSFLPQWSPGLMAGGSYEARRRGVRGPPAAMEPRPDGRGKRLARLR